MINELKIIPFEKHHQGEIDEMMTVISAEFVAPIYRVKSKKILEVAELANYQFWVAIIENKVVGTIGLIRLLNDSIALKNMFLAATVRQQGIGQLLLNHVIKWCEQEDYSTIYLGTMDQFKGGQRFYEKNGFEVVYQPQLPVDFPINALDTLFYKRCLNLNE